MKDDAQGLAAQLSYYFFLSLFPALLCVIAIASFFPLQHLTDDMARLLGPLAPAEVVEIIRQQMIKIGEGKNGGLVSLGFLGAISAGAARRQAAADGIRARPGCGGPALALAEPPAHVILPGRGFPAAR